MLPGTWSVLIDGSGSVVLSQAAGQMTVHGSSPALGCRPCRDHLLPGAMGWGKGEGEGGLYSCSLLLSPRPQLSDCQGLFSNSKSDGAG